MVGFARAGRVLPVRASSRLSTTSLLKPLPILPTRLRWVLGLLATAVCYGIVGWASLKLAVPTHYATPLFPAAGIALACVLVLGPRAALGVALGSFAINR